MGLVDKVSRGAWQITSWHPAENSDRKWEFDGTLADSEIEKHLSPANFANIIDHDAVKGYWRYGNPIAIRLNGRGGFLVTRGSKIKDEIM